MPAKPAEAAPSAAIEAKRLLRLARTGALATIDREGGAPLTTLVGIASDWDGSPLFLMSELARHTRNLAGDARASLLLSIPSGRGDPLNHPRVTVSGPVELHPDPSSRSRYLRRNPKAGLYADFADFAVRRMRIEAVHFNGGFGRAEALTPRDLLTPSGEIGELIAAEDELLREVDALDAPTISRLVVGAPPGRRGWRAMGIDAEGLDLSAGGAAARVEFSAPARDPESWRRGLRELLEG
jgi:heme iron utilization protein